MLGVLLLGGCMAIFATSGGESVEEPEAAPVAIGVPVDVADVQWTVLAAKQANQLTSEFSSENGNFVIVDVRFLNNGNEAVTLDSASLALIDSEGRKSEADPDKFEFIPEGKDLFIDQVNPGVSKDGQAIFTVAPEASGFFLEVGDADLFSDTNARVDLGF